MHSRYHSEIMVVNNTYMDIRIIQFGKMMIRHHFLANAKYTSTLNPATTGTINEN